MIKVPVTSKLVSLILLQVNLFNKIDFVSGSICTGNNASPNWYGAVAYPPYFTRSAPEKCPQVLELSRCELSAVMKDGTSNFATDDSGAEVCTPNVDCFATKHNCNDTLVCSDLVKLHDELLDGGHNIVCRHEKTYWQQYGGEAPCIANGNCLDEDVKATQRQLQPHGWRSANLFATAFREMGIPIGNTFSSPFTRCAQHADLFSDTPNEERLELLYIGGWKEVLILNNITEIVKSNAFKWQAYSLRNLAGKKPQAGMNNVMITHGFNIKRAFGTAMDEGYCMVLKPEDGEPSLKDSIGSLTVANKVFNFDEDSFPVNAIARMTPESAIHMQTCVDVRSEATDTPDAAALTGVLSLYDTNHDMKITKDEFASAQGGLKNSDDAFNFISSVFIQPEVLGKTKGITAAPSIEIGQFFHINWGWREFLTSYGNIIYPWRAILENTIGSGGQTAEARVTSFKQANTVLSQLIGVLQDQDEYPSIVDMENKLINCDTTGREIQHLANCASQAFLGESGGSSYIPIGPGDTGGAASDGELIFGKPVAYPSQWKPDADFYESRSMKVASCLVVQGPLTLSEMYNLMGCTEPINNGSEPDLSAATSEEAGKMAEGLAWTFGVTLVVFILGAVVYGQKNRKDGKNAAATTHTSGINKQMEA
jgi:hypothetical protein